MILDALKKHLYEKEEKNIGRWLRELPSVLWGLRTQPNRNTGVSPYFMVFGSEVVLPADIAFCSPRVENYDEEVSNQACTNDLDLLEEERLTSCLRTAKYLEGVRRYYNRNVKDRSFVVGDLVLKRKLRLDGLHKLTSHWDGPYMVKEVT